MECFKAISQGNYLVSKCIVIMKESLVYIVQLKGEL